jgi:hypothetical protein
MFLQLGVGRVRILRLRCFFACGLVDHLFEQPHHAIDTRRGMTLNA